MLPLIAVTARLHLDLDVRVHQMTVLAVLLALGAAACFGVSSALQHRSSNQEADRAPLDPTLVIRLARRPLWILGGMADIAGLILQALALGKGSLVLVEPLLCAAVLVATPLGAFLDHRRLSRRHVLTLTTIVVSLGAFLAIAAPNEGLSTLRPRLVYAVCGASVALIGVCLLAASRAPSPSRRRGALVALAAGVALGSSSALIKSVITLFGRHGLGIVTEPATYGLVLLGCAALILTQNAFQAGPLGPALAVLTVAEPVIGVVVGLAGLRERIATGPVALSLEAVTAGLTIAGIVVLCLRGDWLSESSSADAVRR